MEVLPISNEFYIKDALTYFYSDCAEESAVVEALAKRLEAELREAKNTHLSVGEVLLPNGLTVRIAQDIFKVADNEPCGLRGCTLYINFDGEGGFNKRLCTFRCDPSTPSTFEVHLTLKQSTAGWSNILPQFIK
ncbi:hypothetical protein GWI33_012520, partial [Rhynchophorus ferrugineus]